MSIYETEDFRHQLNDVARAIDEDMYSVPAILREFHPSDVAALVQYLTPFHQEKLISSCASELSPDVFVDLDPEIQKKLPVWISASELAEIISRLRGDDGLSLLQEFEDDAKSRVLAELPVRYRLMLEANMNYPDKSVGRLMRQEVPAICGHWTISRVLQFLIDDEKFPDDFYDIFVVDTCGVLIGTVPSSRLLTCGDHALQLKDLIEDTTNPIPANLDQEEVAYMFRKYSAASAPVVNDHGMIVGMVTAQDIVDVVEEEAEEDIMLMGKGEAESDFYRPAIFTSLSRVRWLYVTSISSLIASFVIAQFTWLIVANPQLSVLMSIVAAIGGNYGMQVVTVMVRALALHELSSINAWRTFRKELTVASLNSLFLSVSLGLMVFFWFGRLDLSILMWFALIFNIMLGGVCGVVVPITIKALRHDPAISAGPLVIAATDIIGYAMFLGGSAFAFRFLFSGV